MPQTITIKALCPRCGYKVTELHTLTSCCTSCTCEMSVREINRRAREKDESHLFPVNNRFNATERAIRRLRKLSRVSKTMEGGLEYAFALEKEIEDIVNDPKLL